MSLHHTEMFGHFVYSEELSYAELLDREQVLVEALDKVLIGLNAAHLEFTPRGDALRVQCLFGEIDEQLAHAACEAVLPLLGTDVSGRLLFVDKNLGELLLYCLADGAWKESRLELPEARYAVSSAETDPQPSADFPFS